MQTASQAGLFDSRMTANADRKTSLGPRNRLGYPAGAHFLLQFGGDAAVMPMLHESPWRAEIQLVPCLQLSVPPSIDRAGPASAGTAAGPCGPWSSRTAPPPRSPHHPAGSPQP